MFMIHRIYRKSGVMEHSTQFFNTPIPENRQMPLDVKNRMFNICAADGADETIDYALCQVVDHSGGVWRTEIIKPMPNDEQA